MSTSGRHGPGDGTIGAGGVLDVEINFTRHYRMRVRAGVAVADRHVFDNAFDVFLRNHADDIEHQIAGEELPEVGSDGPWLHSVAVGREEGDRAPTLMFDGVAVFDATPFSLPDDNFLKFLWGHRWAVSASMLWRVDAPTPGVAIAFGLMDVNEESVLDVISKQLEGVERVVPGPSGHLRGDHTTERVTSVKLSDGTHKFLSFDEVSIVDGMEMWTARRPLSAVFAVRDGEIVAMTMPLHVKGRFVPHPLVRLGEAREAPGLT